MASGSPGQFTVNGLSLSNLFQRAYSFNSYEFVALPWMDKELYDVAAKVPQGTTLPQFQIMLRNLLTERLKIVSHYERREMKALELSVAQGGPRMDASVTGKAPFRFRWSDGFPVVPPDVVPYTLDTQAKSQRVISTNQCSMHDLAAQLSRTLRIPVIDRTSLTGNYAFLLHYSAGRPILASAPGTDDAPPANPDAEFAPSIFEAIKSQLGLRLMETRAQIDVLVIDSAEKTPIQN